jgi:uncharacterized metal-binding protein
VDWPPPYEKGVRMVLGVSLQAKAELRALIGVARAAQRMMAYDGCGRKVCGTGLDRDCPAVIATDKALARLARASGRPGRKS